MRAQGRDRDTGGSRAATDPAAAGGRYDGSGGPVGSEGYPVAVRSSAYACDEAARHRHRAACERLTGVGFPG